MKISTRREAIKSAAIGGALGAVEFSGLMRARAVEPAAAFALLGDRYHNIDHYRTALGGTLVRDAGISIDFTDELPLLNGENLRRYKLLIILRDGMIWSDGHGNPRSNAGWWSSKSQRS